MVLIAPVPVVACNFACHYQILCVPYRNRHQNKQKQRTKSEVPPWNGHNPSILVALNLHFLLYTCKRIKLGFSLTIKEGTKVHLPKHASDKKSVKRPVTDTAVFASAHVFRKRPWCALIRACEVNRTNTLSMHESI